MANSPVRAERLRSWLVVSWDIETSCGVIIKTAHSVSAREQLAAIADPALLLLPNHVNELINVKVPNEANILEVY
jgi:hypothetical protein